MTEKLDFAMGVVVGLLLGWSLRFLWHRWVRKANKESPN
jgi:hypothetical protein